MGLPHFVVDPSVSRLDALRAGPRPRGAVRAIQCPGKTLAFEVPSKIRSVLLASSSFGETKVIWFPADRDPRQRADVAPATCEERGEIAVFLIDFDPGGIFPVGRFQGQVPASQKRRSRIGLSGNIRGKCRTRRLPSRSTRKERVLESSRRAPAFYARDLMVCEASSQRTGTPRK